MIGSRHSHAGFGPGWNFVPTVQLPLEALVEQLRAVHRHAYDGRLVNLSQFVSQPRQTGMRPQLAGINSTSSTVLLKHGPGLKDVNMPVRSHGLR